jgi:hypothetical protein
MVYSTISVDPKIRGDCLPGGVNDTRPCKWTSCQYHHSSSLCVLDVADEGEHTLEEVSVLLGVSRERIRQIEWIAFKKLRRLKVLR